MLNANIVINPNNFSVYNQDGECVTASTIARQAKRHIGSRTWLYSSSHVTGTNTNKCNIFVADVLRAVGANAPER